MPTVPGPAVRRVGALVAVLSVVSLATGCGRSGTDPNEWARQVCTAVRPWAQTVAGSLSTATATGQGTGTTPSSSSPTGSAGPAASASPRATPTPAAPPTPSATATPDPAAVKQQLLTAFRTDVTATDRVIAAVQRAGVPAADNGTAVADGFLAALRAARQAFARAQSQVQALNPADRAAFDQQVGTIGTALTSDFNRATAGLQPASSPQLTRAFAVTPECQ